ncbi:MAG: cytochrome C [Desulfuromonadales bacterium]|nr:cytochrome C [Desulfuromonadales bacterium]
MKLKGLLILVALALSAGLALAADAVPGGPKKGMIGAKKKANSIAELVAMYDSSSCIECHQEAHEQWERSVHSRSIYGTGRTAATFRTAIVNGLLEWPFSGVQDPKDVKVEHLMGCAKCHLPQLADATDAVAKEIIASIYSWQNALRNDDTATFEKEQAKLKGLNINCLVCHNRNAITHKWTDGYPQAGVVYGSMDGEHPSDKFPKMAKSPIMSESILCGQCHGLGPNLELDNPTQCATAYGSYLWSYRAEGGQESCQECHMRKSGLGHDMQSYRSEAMNKAALDFEAKAMGVYWRDRTEVKPYVSLEVAMTNRAGHVIPDG